MLQAAPSIECSSIALGENFEDSISNFDDKFSIALMSLLNKIDELATEDKCEKMLNVLHRYVTDILTVSNIFHEFSNFSYVFQNGLQFILFISEPSKFWWGKP